MPQATRLRQETYELPASLAAELSPRAQEALGHLVRRQILRILDADDAPRSPSELARIARPRVSISIVSYHAQVLEDCGGVRGLDTWQTQSGFTRLYASIVTDDKQFASILQATEGLDSRRAS